ncbi:hypothetical protein ACI1MP_37595 (plasmid) [Kitasatospora griseola]
MASKALIKLLAAKAAAAAAKVTARAATEALKAITPSGGPK